MTPAALWRRWVALFEDEEDPAAPRFDPVHLAAVPVVCMVVMGALFWLLWTLLVYEGGLPLKLQALAAIAFQGRTLQSFGWTGATDRPGVFEGWTANVAALAVTILVLAALQRADWRHARRARR